MSRLKHLAMLVVGTSGCFWSSAAPYPAPGDTVIFGRESVTPSTLHRATWDEVARCLGVEGRPIESVEWSVADSIITWDGYLAYGISFMPVASSIRTITIERDVWWNFGIISHEAIHVQGNVWGHGGPEWGCELPSPTDLPLRRPGIGVVEEDKA